MLEPTIIEGRERGKPVYAVGYFAICVHTMDDRKGAEECLEAEKRMNAERAEW